MTGVKQWSALTALAIVAVVTGGWFLLISPQRSDAAALREQTVAAEQAARQLRTQLSVLQAQEQELPAKRRRLEEIAVKLPAEVELPTLTRSLEQVAGNAGVRVQKIAPGVPTAASESAGQPLSVVTVELEVEGSYNQVEQLLSELESMPRSFLVTDLSASPATGQIGGVGGSGPKPLAVKITGQVFTRAAPPDVAGAAAPAPAPPTSPSSSSDVSGPSGSTSETAR